jgi:methionyl-tRNA synthetase
VIGYLSASIEWAASTGDPDAWRDWWQNDESRHAYFQGKDNVVFHTVIWPAMRLGYEKGGEYGAGTAPLHLPDNVFASEFLGLEGKQFSTSRQHSIYIRDFLDRYDPDPLRYYLIAAGPETQDTDFTWAEFVRRNNDEVLANWGNLVNRTLTSAHRNFGAVPEPGELTAEDSALLDGVAGGFGAVGEHIDGGRFRAALAEAMRLASTVNTYVSDQAPWALVKTDRERAATVLFVALRAVDSLKTIFTPFLPHTSQVVHELLGYEGYIAGPLVFREVEEEGGRKHEILTGDYRSWVGTWAPSELQAGQALQEPRQLFKKLDDSVVDEELARMREAADAA